MADFTVETEDGSLIAGKVDSPAEPRSQVVVVHGMGGHMGRYDFLTQRLVGAGHAVWRFDQRGHGATTSQGSAPSDPATLVGDVAMVVSMARSAADTPVFCFGHCSGALACALHGIAHPGSVEGYLLSGIWADDRAGLIPWLMEGVDADADDDHPIPNRLAPGVLSSPEGRAAYESDDSVATEIPLGYLRAVGRAQATLAEKALHFTDPVLLMHGAQDPLVAPESSCDLFSAVGSADRSLRIYGGFYHELMGEVLKGRPAADVVQWLDDQLA